MNTVVLIFPRVQRLHLMYFEVAWVLVSLGYLPAYFSVSYDYGKITLFIVILMLDH